MRELLPTTIRGGIAAVVVTAALVLGLTPVAAGAADGSTGARAASSTQCSQVRKRLVGAPATLRRVDANLTELRARLAVVRLPVRRTLLEQRIERLEQLRGALEVKITEARAACGAADTTT